jgi:hypothetical protein
MLEKLSLFENVPPSLVLVLEGGLVIGAVTVLFKVIQSRKGAAERASYPRDVVVLHQFPRGLRAPSASPFPLKVETWFVNH